MGKWTEAVKSLLETPANIKKGTKDAPRAAESVRRVESGDAEKARMDEMLQANPAAMDETLEANPDLAVEPEQVARSAVNPPPDDLARTQERNFGLQYVDEPEDIGALIDNVAEQGGGFLDQRRGVRSNFETEAEAQRMIDDGEITDEALFGIKPGTTANAEQLTAARMIMVDSAEGIRQAAQAVVDGNATARQMVEFRHLVARHAAIQMHVQGLAAEAGRALQSFQITAKSAQINAHQVSEMLNNSGGEKDARQLARYMLDARNLNEVTKIAKEAHKPNMMDAALEVWINGLLSGPTTHFANIGGNLMSDAFAKAERLVAGGIGSIRTGANKGASWAIGREVGTQDRVMLGETTAQLMGWTGAYWDGIRMMGSALKTGESQMDFMSKVENFDRRAFTSQTFGAENVPFLGKGLDVIGEWYVRLPGRVLQAEDDLFKGMAYRSEINALAYRKAVQSGADDVGAEMTRLLANPTEELHEAAMQQARVQTFTNELGSMGQGLQTIANSNPVAKVIFPFLRTPVNLTKWAIHRSPLTVATPNFWSDFNAGGARKDMALARLSMGSAIAASFYVWGSDGTITGSGPESPALRKVMMASGWKANSILVDGEYVSYDRLDPFGMLIGIYADTADMYRYAVTDEQRDEVALFMALAVAENLTSKQYMRGLNDILQVLSKRKSPTEYAGRQISSIVPSWLNTAARVMDDTQRDARTNEGLYEAAVAHIKKRTPGHSKDIPPYMNIWGEINTGDGILGPNFISPLYRSKGKDDKLARELIENGVGVSEPSCIIKTDGAQLNTVTQVPHSKGAEWSCFEYRQSIGQARLEAVEAAVNSKHYKDLVKGVDGGKGSRAAILRSAVIAGRELGRNRYLQGLMERDDLEAPLLNILEQSLNDRSTNTNPLPKHFEAEPTPEGPTL